jgi:hypothetical protein
MLIGISQAAFAAPTVCMLTEPLACQVPRREPPHGEWAWCACQTMNGDRDILHLGANGTLSRSLVKEL